MSVQLQGNTLPSIKIIDLDVTVAYGQIVEITNIQYAQSRNAQALVSRRLLTQLVGPPQTPTEVNMSDVDPATFNVRPQVLELEDCSPGLQTLITTQVVPTQVIANLPTGGSIGAASTTVDVCSSFNIHQTTVAQTITVPSPTVTTAGLKLYVNNVGSTSFTMLGKVVPIGAGFTAMWNGTAWSLVGFGG